MDDKGGRVTRILLVVEAAGDAQHVGDLVDRVLRERVEWLADQDLDHHREWVRNPASPYVREDTPPFLTWTGLKNLRAIHGGFATGPGGGMALAARKAIGQGRTHPDLKADVVVLVHDADRDGAAHRVAFAAARQEYVATGRFDVVMGIPDMEREAWILKGFVPQDDGEAALLDTEKRRLSFDPTREPERLRDAKDHEERSPKRVVNALTCGDDRRARSCWTDALLGRLWARRSDGEDPTGLAEFLDELEARLVPFYQPRAHPDSPS